MLSDVSSAKSAPHQYVDRESGEVRTERLIADRTVGIVYSSLRENAPIVYRLATGRTATRLLASFHYGNVLSSRLSNPARLFSGLGADIGECVLPPRFFKTPRDVFERKIRYWETRPMPEGENIVVCPADSRLLTGSLSEFSHLFVKGKFFSLAELLGERGEEAARTFGEGDFAIFRLTPDKYHYSHFPVSGRIRDLYEVDGKFHSCNPTAVLAEVTPHSKNKRVVTLIDTDVKGGTGVGLVAMIEVVALMIGEVVQRYSPERYENPVAPTPGDFVVKGAPKSLFRPGSSTDILIFEPGRVVFASDILENQRRCDVSSRFSLGFGKNLVETDVKVRQELAVRRTKRSNREGK